MRSFLPSPRFPALVAGDRFFPVRARSFRSDWLVRRGAIEMCRPSSTMQSIEGKFGQKTKDGYLPPRTVTLAEKPPSELILPRLAAGDSRAMSECIERYGNLVWGLVRRSIKDNTEAEDLVQEIFTEIWKKAGFFDPALASESTFIGLITRRRAIDYLRRQSRQPGFEPLDAADSIPAPAATAASISCDPEAVKSSVATLPDDTRELFQLFFEDGFTHPEIAEKTGLPLGTVKTRLRRGLISLRENLRRVGISNIQPAS
jgi:RNA polymerase sigma-70 factor (ECF subfamily)